MSTIYEFVRHNTCGPIEHWVHARERYLYLACVSMCLCILCCLQAAKDNIHIHRHIDTQARLCLILNTIMYRIAGNLKSSWLSRIIAKPQKNLVRPYCALCRNTQATPPGCRAT